MDSIEICDDEDASLSVADGVGGVWEAQLQDGSVYRADKHTRLYDMGMALR